MGQVIALAYLDAYNTLVSDLGGLTAAVAGPQAEKAVAMKRPGRLYAGPSIKTKALKDLDPGAILYPTGNKQDGMWEVEDELGTKGWVAEASITVAR